MLAWLAWGVLILGLRYQVERQQQKIAAREAQEALNA
jgi:heme exporter protein C